MTRGAPCFHSGSDGGYLVLSFFLRLKYVSVTERVHREDAENNGTDPRLGRIVYEPYRSGI